ncbi:matrix metalloproteinase-2-like isoform X2 [Lineus longissimus]|uniref:matrix metalloproteinase-2-like isoform X2 n=1 Tax=Lineus longissimus TaxID=88925 RepID=UPI00315CA5A7
MELKVQIHHRTLRSGKNKGVILTETWHTFYLLVVTILFSIVETRPTPLPPSYKHGTKKPVNPGVAGIMEHGMGYLMKFGYLPQSDLETGELRSSEDLKRAIKDFQRIAHIPETGVLDAKTLDFMQKRRCGVPDTAISNDRTSRTRNKRYAFAGSKWYKNDLTYTIRNYSPDMNINETRDAVRRAFNVWSAVTSLTFREIMRGEADINIQFAVGYHADGYPFDGKGLILAHAFFPGDGRGGDTHFDDDETWSYKDKPGVNLFSVAAHEFGHALGLGHSSVEKSLMYPWYQGYVKNFRLPEDDIRGIHALYGDPNVIPTKPIDRGPGPRPDPTTISPPRQVPTRVKFVPIGNRPDTCRTSFDATAVVRNEIFIFKGKWFWRVTKNGLVDGYPVELNRFWFGFPDNMDSVDAVYESPLDGYIVFFKGKKYWRFNGNHVIVGFPQQGRPITELGLPHDLEKIDAAFVWGHNKKTYLMSGDMYWRFNEKSAVVDYDYPRDMSMWKGVPTPVDASFRSWDGITYFMKGLNYYAFNDAKMRVREGYPKSALTKWLGCSPYETKVMTSDNVIPGMSDRSAAGQEGHNSAEKYSASAVMIVLCLLTSYFTQETVQ